MNNLPLKPLKWSSYQYSDGVVYDAVTPICEYDLMPQKDGGYTVKYYNRQTEEPTKEATGFATADEAKAWAWKHYNEKMQPYVKPDSIADIANWFKAAKPEPTDKDICVQLGCHFEEISEMNEAILGVDTWDIDGLANHFKYASKLPKDTDKIELLDALCDQIVTATGVAYMMGFDIEGALKEVIRSNNSKMSDGKFEYDENGKIAKPESYREPDLAPFLSKGE